MNSLIFKPLPPKRPLSPFMLFYINNRGKFPRLKEPEKAKELAKL